MENNQYVRDDIYLCADCGKFHSLADDSVVDVPYSEMPAQVAINVMSYRQELATKSLKKRKKRFNDL